MCNPRPVVRFLAHATLLLMAGDALGELTYLPSYLRNPQPRFEVRDRALWADGEPMPILYEFTWSAPRDEELYHYHNQFLGNSHWHPLQFDAAREPGYQVDHVDEHYAKAARHRVFMTLSPHIQSPGSYPVEHPDARMQTNKGEIAKRQNASFMHAGWRNALTQGLKRLGTHVADKPYHLGYYPQDEYAYRCFGGYEPAGIAAFRRWLLERYGTVEALNRAWGSTCTNLDAVEPPREFEKSVAFADWQEYRRWAQIDYTRSIYEALHDADPNGMVIWSLPFWGSWSNAASWWDFAPYTDIFMRHGIGYRTGVYRLQMLRSLSEWSGKPANALCMPPDYNPTYVQFGFMLDGPRSGLSHVCVGGAESHAYYMGAADSDNGWKRREPMYTKSRALNDLVRYLGPTYLLSQRRQPKLGVFVGDRTVLLNGTNLNSLNGMLNLLSDLNIEIEIFCEKNVGDLSRFAAVIAGSYARCINAELSTAFRGFVDDGGWLILTRGAFAADWVNRDAGDPGLGWSEGIGNAVNSRTATLGLRPDAWPAPVPTVLPAAGEVTCRTPSDATVLAVAENNEPVIVRRDRLVYMGLDPGSVYTAGYTDEFAGISKTDDTRILDDFAGFAFDHELTNAELVKFGEHRAYTQLFQVLLAQAGVLPELSISGPGKALGALRARVLTHDKGLLLCVANRVVQPGKDHKDTPARNYHRVHRSLRLSTRISKPLAYAVQLPFASVSGQSVQSLPIPLATETTDGAMTVALPELVDIAAVLVTDDYPPLLGIALDRRSVVAGERVKVCGRIVNPSPRLLQAAVRLDVSGSLVAPDTTVELVVKPGAALDFEQDLQIPVQTETGYYIVQWVAQCGEQRTQASTSLELELLEDLQIRLVEARLTRFPVEDDGSIIEARITSNLPDPVPVSLTVSAPEGYRAEPQHQTIRASRTDGTVNVRATIVADGSQPPPVTFADVRVEATVRGQPVIREQRIRLARGAVTYREPKSIRYGAAQESRHDAELIVLENPILKATFVEDTGVFHELILRETGSDHFCEGDYPFGMTWYAGPGGWRLEELSPAGATVSAKLEGRTRDGTPISLTATLAQDEPFVKLVYDTHGLKEAYGAFYIMSRLSRSGAEDTMITPLVTGIHRAPWFKGKTIEPPAADLTQRWLAVHSTEQDEVLGVVYDIPALDKVVCRPRSAGHNYWIFKLKPEPPETMTFWVSAQKGGVDRIRELCNEIMPETTRPADRQP